MFLLSYIHYISHVRKTFTLQMSAFTGFQFGKHCIGHLHKVTVLLAIHDTKRMHIRVLAKILQLRLFIVRIYSNIYRTDLRTSIQQCQPIGNISRPDTHMGTTFHPNGDKPFRHIIHTTVQLTPGKTEIAVGINDIFLIGSLFSPVLEPLSQSTIK